MTEIAATSSGPAQTSPGLFGRVFGVLISPRETYTAVAASPRWFGVLAVILVVMVTAQGVFLSTEVGKEALLDIQVRTLESFGVNISDQMYTQMESRLAYAPYTGAVQQLIFIPLACALVAGLLVGVFTMLLGGSGTFKQVYSIVVHSGVVTAVQALFNMPLSYARGEFASANLAVFVPMLDEMSFVTRFLGAIDLFLIWWSVNLAIGVGVLYKRKTGGIATSLIGVYVLIALVLALVRSGS